MIDNIIEIDTLIVGTGFAGICMAIKLAEAKSSFVVLEKKSDLGGVWKKDNYPGCQCDVQSHLYSYSFEPNPNWMGTFGESKEIHDYLVHCVEKYSLKESIQFNQECVHAIYDASISRWTVKTKEGRVYSCRYFVLGLGALHKPNIPDFKGMDNFQGELWHSDRWNHDYDFTGKKVVSIGAGASAIQYLPQIADKVSELTVIQRSAAWVMPRSERRYTAFEKRVLTAYPFLSRPLRWFYYWSNELRLIPIHKPKLAALVSNVAKKIIHKTVKDPETQKKLTPDYVIGCKRILVSSDYYPIFNLDGVSLVTENIKSFDESGVVTSDGAYHQADAVILGTGYLLDPRVYMNELDVVGCNGATLKDRWTENLASYFGITVPGFPNMFQLSGPNSGLSHNSVIFMIEAQVQYIISAMKKMQQSGVKSIEVKSEPFDKFNQAVQGNYQGTVWSSGCTSHYKDVDGKNIVLWPLPTWKFRSQTRSINLDDYHCVT